MWDTKIPELGIDPVASSTSPKRLGNPNRSSHRCSQVKPGGIIFSQILEVQKSKKNWTNLPTCGWNSDGSGSFWKNFNLGAIKTNILFDGFS